jgi:predicted O-methyltransferase YrrM
MKRRLVAAVGVGGVLLAAVCLSVHSGEEGTAPAKKESPAELRERIIRNFPRTGLATTPGDAMLLRILVQARGAKRGIEVGTERGFGAINMGVGFERTGGHLYTLEINPRTAEIARENVRKMKLTGTVTVVEGDALKTLPKLEGEFDFLFLDALKRDYLKYLKAVEAKLKPGAVIVADNAIRSARSMRDFLDYLKESPNYEMVIIRASMEKRDGLAVCYKIR